MTVLSELTDVNITRCERASAAILRDTALPRAKHRIVHSYAHDRFAFTQGLLFADGHLFESTGWWGKSSIRKVRLEDGAVLAKRALPENVFGEGLTCWGDEIISLTWRDRRGFRWSLADLSPLGIAGPVRHVEIDHRNRHPFFKHRVEKRGRACVAAPARGRYFSPPLGRPR